MEKRKITIEVDENIVSELADILCYFAGFNDGKEDWRSRWIMDSVDTLRRLKIDIYEELKNSSPLTKL